jgi:hypothetical protein
MSTVKGVRLTPQEEMKEVLKLFDTLGEHCLASVELLSTVPARTIVPTFETRAFLFLLSMCAVRMVTALLDESCSDS